MLQEALCKCVDTIKYSAILLCISGLILTTQGWCLPGCRLRTWKFPSSFKSKDLTRPMEVPKPIKSPGMDAARKWYLYHKIRPFVADPWKDVMCPLPDVPQTSSATDTHEEEAVVDETTTVTKEKPGQRQGTSSMDREQTLGMVLVTMENPQLGSSTSPNGASGPYVPGACRSRGRGRRGRVFICKC